MIDLITFAVLVVGNAYILIKLSADSRQAKKDLKKAEERLTEEIKLTLLTPTERRSLHSRYMD